MSVILYVIAFIAILYWVAIKPYTYWSKKGVKTGFFLPIIGDSLWIFFGIESFTDFVSRLYQKVPNTRYSGSYQAQLPVLYIKTPELIRQVCVKDFDHFVDHRNMVPDDADELWSKNLVILRGHKWKNMRSTLSPSFTSSKMKAMFTLICKNSQFFIQHFLKNNDEIAEVDVKDVTMRYSVDVIANAAFGYETNSLEDRNNEFYEMGKAIGTFGANPKQRVAFFLYNMVPSIAKLLGLTIFEKKVKDFFTVIAGETIRTREEQNIKRPDMVGLLLEARKGINKMAPQTEEIKESSFSAVDEHLEMKNLKELSDADISSQMFIFFFAGFDTVSTAMTFLVYELAVNPDVQEKLIEEIDANKPEEGGHPSYETISNLTYMDMVISETLRKWPAAVVTDRVVTKPYTIEPELADERPVHLDVNDNILIPIFAIHRDPKNYDDPSKFDPERFSPENRHKINQYAYLPFGVGPRNCIGSRFALMEIKALFFCLLSHYEIVPVAETQIPLKLSKKSFNPAPEKKLIVGFKRRQNV